MRVIVCAALTALMFQSGDAAYSAEAQRIGYGNKCISKPVVGAAANEPSSYFVCQQSLEALLGFHWGLGLLYSSDLGGIGQVDVVPGANNTSVVKVQKQNNSAARAGLELHYFIPIRFYNSRQDRGYWRTDYLLMQEQAIDKNGVLAASWKPSDWEPEMSIGPFISLNTRPLDQLGNGNPFPSAGMGIMVGGKPFLGGSEDTSSVQLGLGWLIDTDVKELSPEFTDGQATTHAQAVDVKDIGIASPRAA